MPAYYDEQTKTWYCKFYYTDYTGTRKQKKKRGFYTKREAAAWEREFLFKLQGTPDMTFKSLAELYEEDLKARTKPSTYKSQHSSIKLHILPYFGNRPINTITPADVRKWQNELKSTGLSPSTIVLKETYLSAIFNFAVRCYGLPSNPLTAAGKTKVQKIKRLDFWTLEEFQKFIAAVDAPQYRVLFLTLYYTGMRIGEALALTLSDINYENCTISISKTMQTADGVRFTTSPKTASSNRIITIPEQLRNELISFINTLYDISENDYIFTCGKTAVRKSLNKYAEMAAVKQIRIHDLRHSHASLLINMGVQPLLISERLGHDNIQTTLNIYGHLYPSKHAEIAELLNDFF